MAEFDLQYPGYGFAKHKGYPFKEHVAALQKLGACPVHRRSFGPVREVLGPPPQPPPSPRAARADAGSCRSSFGRNTSPQTVLDWSGPVHLKHSRRLGPLEGR
jgi:hypothetical protein